MKKSKKWSNVPPNRFDGLGASSKPHEALRASRLVRRLDVLVLALCGLALLAGPLMALQEVAKARDEAARGLVLDPQAAPQDLDVGYRLVWRGAMLVLTLAVDIGGSLVMLRVGRQPRVRGVSARLLWLLVAGLAWLDLAFLLDGRYLLDAPYVQRALVVSWIYAVGALLVAGSVFRLGDVESMMARDTRAAATREADA